MVSNLFDYTTDLELCFKKEHLFTNTESVRIL